jgi:Ca2+-binding EF-hand superfamily protein
LTRTPTASQTAEEDGAEARLVESFETKGDPVAEDKGKDEQSAPPAESDDVEAHGTKQAVGIGLAAAALLGAGAAGVKIATDDSPRERVQGALTTRETAEGEAVDIKAADRDGDGYLTYRELADVGMKWDIEGLRAEGLDVTIAGLSAAGSKHLVESVGKEDGFLVEGDTIMLKFDVDPELDATVKGSAIEWTEKLRAIDRDADGYAAHEELLEAGFKYNVSELQEAGYKVTAEELEKAGYKVELENLGEGGFVMEAEAVMFKQGVDDKLDAFIKGELG